MPHSGHLEEDVHRVQADDCNSKLSADEAPRGHGFAPTLCPVPGLHGRSMKLALQSLHERGQRMALQSLHEWGQRMALQSLHERGQLMLQRQVLGGGRIELGEGQKLRRRPW